MGNWLPWGMQSQRKKAIEGFQKKRNEGFLSASARVATKDDALLKKREGIVKMNLEQLRNALQKDELRPTEVLNAYMAKALEVQERLNCLGEVVVECWERAEALEREWTGRGNKPPLYGIPFSVKSNFHLKVPASTYLDSFCSEFSNKGYDCNLGLGKYVDMPMTDECTLVTHLCSLGAIPFVVTTVPQALLSFVCSSSVYGTTLNPYDQKRGPGGSSGGEAALLAAGGSPFGIGSDLLGSLRIPAHMCGLVTLKPTESRLICRNAHGGVPGKGRIGLGYGFFTKSLDENIALLKQIIGSPEYCRLVPESSRTRINDTIIETKEPLRIGYFEDDGFLRPIPSITRAVRDTVELLRKEGHEMVRFEVPKVEEAATLMYKNAMPDAGVYSRFLYSNDVVDQYMKQFVLLLRVPNCIRAFLARLLRPLSPQLAIVGGHYMKNLDDLRYTQERTDIYKQEFIEYWKNLGIDALICPSFAVTALPHDAPSQLSPCGFATGLFNLVDFPCGVLPISKVTEQDDADLDNDQIFPTGRNPILRVMRKGCEGSAGLPLTVQVVTLPLEEEKCLRVMKIIEKAAEYNQA